MAKYRIEREIACAIVVAAHVLVIGCADVAREQDDGIARAVKQSLYDHEPVNLLRVDVSAHRGVIYLSGEVDEYRHKEEAERLSGQIEGVSEVVNKVQVEQ
jgi:osmotically-inducible protein OsmY